MPNSKSIGTCKDCDQLYCFNCSDAEAYNEYCSKQCEKDAKEVEDKEKEEEKIQSKRKRK